MVRPILRALERRGALEDRGAPPRRPRAAVELPGKSIECDPALALAGARSLLGGRRLPLESVLHLLPGIAEKAGISVRLDPADGVEVRVRVDGKEGVILSVENGEGLAGWIAGAARTGGGKG